MSRAGKVAGILLGAMLAWPRPLRAEPATANPSERAWKKVFLLTRAGDAFATGKFAEAEQLFRSVIRIDPKDEVALRHLANLALKKGDKASALLWLTRATDAHPESFSAQHELGGLLLSLGQAAEAAPHF